MGHLGRVRGVSRMSDASRSMWSLQIDRPLKIGLRKAAFVESPVLLKADFAEYPVNSSTTLYRLVNLLRRSGVLVFDGAGPPDSNAASR